VKFGIGIFQTDTTVDVVKLGRTVEDLGFESLWFVEHSHIPTNRRSQWPGATGPELEADNPLPEEYRRTLDPFVAHAAVAAVTKRIKLGFGVCLVVQRDPIHTAKDVASLDFVSGGRVLFGVGAGWNREEMADHGTDPSTRFRLMKERILAMKEIWTNDVAEFHGEFVDFEPMWQFPKPVQQPHPPIILAGEGPKALSRVVAYGDGWLPFGAGPTAETLPERLTQLQRMAEEAGRAPIPTTLFGAPRQPDVLQRYQELGVDRCLFMVPPLGEDVVLPKLEQYAALAAKFNGAATGG
jgi:probable F420-dependent oxidoreductase